MPGSAKPSTSRKRSKPLASLRPRSWHPLIGARLIADRDVPRAKPLAEIGLDSLMGVELAISIEERFALQGSLTASATGLTIAEFGDQIIGMSDDTETASTSVIAARRRASSRQGGCRSSRQSRRTHRSASAPPSEAVRLGRRFTMPCARSRRGGA
jgi:acyl carrier protein